MSKYDATVRPERSGEINRFPRVTLTAPSASGFLLLLAEVDRRPWWLVPASHVKSSLLKRLKTQCAGIASSANIASTVVFRAFLAAPRGHSAYLARRHAPAHRARFDVVVLIEAASPERIGEILQSAEFVALEQALHSAARYTETIVARNVKRIGPVDQTRDGVFLFNYFVAGTQERNLAVWEYTAGWFEQETGLDNSTVLLPLDPAATTYSLINHCRWDRLRDVLPSLVFKRSFRNYVLANFDENDTAPMPILYRLA
jgi:hypothetical protein